MSADRVDSALVRVERLVRELIEAGLERSAPDLVEEIRELSRTVHHARLVRLERELAGMATVAERYLSREPSFTFASWIGACARVDELARAARRILADPARSDADEILGVARRTYEPIAGPLRIHPLGASGWVSDSGFCGITVHLWDPDHERILQATVARPVALVGPDPRRLLFHPVSEVAMVTLHELAHGSWILDDVRLSSDGRLSLHSRLAAVPAPPIGRRAYRTVEVAGASEALDRLAERDLALVQTGASLLALVDVAAIREVRVDETAARATAEVVDPSGSVWHVSVPLRPQHDLLVENLARLQRAPPAALLGRPYLSGNGLGIDPYTAVFDTPVALALRRGKEFQEVHLALEPLPGAITVPSGRARPTPAAQPVLREVRAALDEIQAVIERLYGAGTAAVQPGLVAEIEALADAWGAAGVTGAEARLRALAEASRAGGGTDALGALTAWLGSFRSGLALESARVASGAKTERRATPKGEDLVLQPLGAELRGDRLAIHALAGSAYVVLEDELPGVDSTDPFAAPVPSRLFQDAVRLGEVLRHAIELRDHPIARAPGRWVVRPAFHTAARSLDEPVAVELPESPRAHGPGPFRVRARAVRDPAGWVIRVPGLEDRVVEEALLQLDLEKRSVDPERLSFDLVGVLRRDRLAILSLDGRFPTLDPRASRWKVEHLRERASTAELRRLIDGLRDGDRVGPDPLPVDRAALEALVGALRAEVRRGGVLPSGAELWSLGTAFAAATRAEGPPIRALSLPIERLWLGAAAPLASWSRGGASEARARDALLLAIGAGLGDVLVD